ncbi:hypothetical protein [Pedobacter sp. SL55]|uniref:hypothetical protein n=1 Tax=Pedobacter sp. SL55 TaxID=2995161 RepID=UPI00226E25B9|nr:hypothetical protein [Pedobacter sp. SL55]WAC41204.1 hypothetical protein OVA16_02175 [Pedobacter sp. SL55]
MPLKETYYELHNQTKTHLVAYRDSLGNIISSIMVMRPEKGSIKSIEGQTNLKNFTGDILLYTLDKNFIRGRVLKDGQIIGELKIETLAVNNTATNGEGKYGQGRIMSTTNYQIPNKTQAWQEECQWRQGQNYINAQGEVVVTAVRYCRWTYQPDEVIPPISEIDYTGAGPSGWTRYDCNGDAEGTAYEADCGCIEGNTGLTACPTREIRDSVQNPCIKAQLNLALTAKTTILNMLNNTFGGTVEFEDLSLTFKDVTNLPDSISGDAKRWSATSIEFEIRLNKNKLPTYSNEYTLSTIYHEILHAYLYSKLTKGLDGKYNISTQHEDMADNYLILMIGALKIAFPNISNQEAWALSWGGLEKTNLYSTKLTQTQKEIIADINRRHTNKPAADKQGTYCN